MSRGRSDAPGFRGPACNDPAAGIGRPPATSGSQWGGGTGLFWDSSVERARVTYSNPSCTAFTFRGMYTAFRPVRKCPKTSRIPSSSSRRFSPLTARQAPNITLFAAIVVSLPFSGLYSRSPPASSVAGTSTTVTSSRWGVSFTSELLTRRVPPAFKRGRKSSEGRFITTRMSGSSTMGESIRSSELTT